jgi:hypothetical protein
MPRSPRPTKTGRRSPAQSEALRALWQQSEYRSKMIAARHRSAEDRRKNSNHYSRLHVPNGMHKAEAMAARRTACELADTIMKNFEAQGIIPEVVIPDSDDDIAKAALREAVIIAVSPGDKRTRLMAANTVLRYTKAPPVQRHATAIVTAEDWLQQAVSALHEHNAAAHNYANEGGLND